MLKLPVLDLQNDSPEVQAKTIREALGTIGFFEVHNSGLDTKAIEKIFSLVSSEHVLDHIILVSRG